MRILSWFWFLMVITISVLKMGYVNSHYALAQVTNVTLSVRIYHLCTAKDAPVDDCRFAGDYVVQNGNYVLCKTGETDYGCGASGYPSSWGNPVTLSLEDYCRDVVPNELNFGPLAAVQAQAVTCRSYALQQSNSGRDPIDNSSWKQVFIPLSRTALTNQAVDTTTGYFLTYDSQPAFTEFSPDHFDSDMTKVGNKPYLISIYDPIPRSSQGSNSGHGRGMSQRRAVNWASGYLDGDNYYPIWDFLRILAHYYTAIYFQNAPNAHNGYRFNVIQISNLPDGYTFTPSRTLMEGISLIVQNSGTLPWYPGQGGQSNCAAGTYNLALSYHLYETNSHGNSTRIACGDPDVPGGNRCFEGVRTRLCVPFADAETSPGGTFLVEGVTVKIPAGLPVGKCYNLRWDIELNNNHTEKTWISGLQLTPWQARWPTQDTRICYLENEASTPNPPQNPHSGSGHEVNRWSNNPNLTIAWDAPDGPVSGYEYRYQGAGSDIADGQWHSTNNQQVSFTATQDGNHSLQLRAVLNDNRSSSVEVGPYLLDRQPPSLMVGSPLENWVTTNQFTLDWHSIDTASGLSHYDVYSTANPNVPWTPLALNTTTEMLSITGNDDQTFYFRIIAYDRAGNSGEFWKSIQVRTFPYLSVSPGSFYRTFILTNTAPSLESLQILNNGGRVMTWTAETNFPYLTLPATTGIDDTILPITLTHPLTYGLFRGVLTITGGSDTRDSPAIVPITVNVVDKLDYYLPLIIKNEE